MAEPFPRSRADLTAGWLTATLQAAGALPAGSRVTGFDIAPVARRGVNGETDRLAPGYAGAPGPPTLIAKWPTESGRGVMAFQRWHEREVRAYRHVASPDTLGGPACYFGAYDEHGDFVLLLEDLGHLRQGDQVAGCADDEAHAAVTALARLHARWEGAHDALEDWLPRTTVGVERAGPVAGALARAWGAIRASAPVAPAARAVIDRLLERYPGQLRLMAAPPTTVIHGDFRLDNLFFARDPGGPRPLAIDWQFTSAARGAYDLAYFITLDFESARRRAIEPALVAAYLDARASAGRPVEHPDRFEEDFRRALLLAMATFVIGAAAPSPDSRSALVHAAGLSRLADAIVDHDAGALLD